MYPDLSFSYSQVARVTLSEILGLDGFRLPVADGSSRHPPIFEASMVHHCQHHVLHFLVKGHFERSFWIFVVNGGTFLSYWLTYNHFLSS